MKIINQQEHEKVTVQYSQETHWLFMNISVGDQTVKIRMSDVYDPIPSLIHWMEAILTDVEECAFTIDEEGTDKGFRALNRWDGIMFLVIDDRYCVEEYIHATVNKRQMIDVIYNGLRSFADSDAYYPENWEIETLEDRLMEASSMNREEVLDEMVQFDAEQLSGIFFATAPRYSVTWPALGDDASRQFKKFVENALSTENKDQQLGMKETSIEWIIDEDWDSWASSWRMKYLSKYIRKNVGDRCGTKLRELHSPTIEAFLEIIK